MSKAKDSYLRLYGTCLNETAAGDYIKELEQLNTEFIFIIEEMIKELHLTGNRSLIQGFNEMLSKHINGE